jgi:citrate synthase
MRALLWDGAMAVAAWVLGAPWWAALIVFLVLRALGWLAQITATVQMTALAMTAIAAAVDAETEARAREGFPLRAVPNPDSPEAS